MDLIEKTVEFITAIEAGNWHKVEKALDFDFKFFGPTPDPFSKETWLEYQRAVREAFPDWSFHLMKVVQDGNKVTITFHIAGTHTKTLRLPDKDAKPLPPSQIHVNLPVENATLIYRGDSIETIHTGEKTHGGLIGLLEQLGID